jgi:hypothetical protein
LKFFKEVIKKIVFTLFPHVKHYNERISNLEVAIKQDMFFSQMRGSPARYLKTPKTLSSFFIVARIRLGSKSAVKRFPNVQS